MPGVIDRQLESLSVSASEAPAKLSERAPAAVTQEIEDLLALSVVLFERMKTGVERWQSSVTDWAANDWVDQARILESRYRKLRETFERIEITLAEREAHGIEPDGAGKFREAKRELDLLCQLSVDRMLKADKGFSEGRGRPMAEVRDELRRRLGA